GGECSRDDQSCGGSKPVRLAKNTTYSKPDGACGGMGWHERCIWIDCRVVIVFKGDYSYFFFFSSRRRHTRLQGDLSSDVCSSDLGATLLQALTKSMMPLTVLFNGFTTESFPFAVCSQVDDTKINTEGIRRLIGSRGRDIEGDSQVECPVAIEQISLPFDGIQTGLLIASHTEGNEDATRERQERNGSQSLEGHDSLIIDESPFRLKGGLNALISLIHIGCFADGPNSQLSRQM